jgi:CheY-like chemotaxis protein
MADPSSFRAAKQKLEIQMTDKQQRLMFILTGNCRYESSSAKEEAVELLENEIEDRKNAIERLEAQSCCDFCGTHAVRETCRIRVTTYSEKFPTMKLKMEKVHVTVECADCRCNHDSQQQAERIVATQEEIVRKIQTLPFSQWQDLKKFADRRARGFPANLGKSKTGEDLFQEALVQTFDGRKKWNVTAVDIFGHLLFAMKNIAHGWEDKFYRWESTTLEAVTHNPEGDEVSRLDKMPSSDPSVDRCISAKDEVERLFGKFKEDKVATAVLQAKKVGLTTVQEIMQEQSLTKRQYEAARKRIRSQKSVLVVEDENNVRDFFARWLKSMDFAVVTASTYIEGLCLYRESGPFDVVMMSHLNGVELAMNLRQRCPSQNMIITTTHCSEEDVVRPSELVHVAVLLKPFSKDELRAALDSFANSAKEQPANRCRQKRRKVPTFKIRMPLRIDRASKLPKRDGIHSTTPPSSGSTEAASCIAPSTLAL